MGWLDKLKDLVGVKIDSLIRINIINNSFNKKEILDKDKPIFYDSSNKHVFVNIEKLDEKQKNLLRQTIYEFKEEGNKFLESDTHDILTNLYQYKKKESDEQILEFFRPIISKDDLEALEASLYLRSVFAQKENVKKLKQDIREVFGNRGNNISNLCTVGYFAKFLVPLYNNTTREKFRKIYEVIVGKAVLTVFVHKDMPIQNIPGEIKSKVTISKKYGLKFIHIHGIGKGNVRKIKDCLENQKKFFEIEFYGKKVFENEEKNIIIIELFL